MEFKGIVRSGGGVRYSGNTLSFPGGIESASPPVGDARELTGATRIATDTPTFSVDMSKYDPASEFARQAGSMYVTVESSECAGGVWKATTSRLSNRVYFVPCDVTISNAFIADITIISTGTVSVGGATTSITALDELPAIIAAKGIKVAANKITITGDLWSPSAVAIGSTIGKFGCVYAETIAIEGNTADFGPSCPGPA